MLALRPQKVPFRLLQRELLFPERKISETFLDFAKPLLDSTPNKVTKVQIEKCMKIAFTVWNSVVYDSVNGNLEYVTKLRRLFSKDPEGSILIEGMISRKKAMFGDDFRVIGEYKITKRFGGWNFRVEKRDPWSIKGSNEEDARSES